MPYLLLRYKDNLHDCFWTLMSMSSWAHMNPNHRIRIESFDGELVVEFLVTSVIHEFKASTIDGHNQFQTRVLVNMPVMLNAETSKPVECPVTVQLHQMLALHDQ